MTILKGETTMADISAKIVMELRTITGAGMMDCKKALAAVEGDMDKAVDFLREKGLAAAAKKASRIAAEGIVSAAVSTDGKVGALVEVNCETDFVAKTPEYVELVNGIANQIIAGNPADVDALMTQPSVEAGQTINDLVNTKIAKIGEKITIRRFVRYELEATGMIETYIHMGGKVGVIVEAHCESEAGATNEKFTQFVHDLALQIAAASPEYVYREHVKADHLEHEKEILAAQARNEGKPENIVQRMLEGRVAKFFKEVCLHEQPFVKNPDQSIAQLTEEVSKVLGEKVTISRFDRYKMGDGLEKKVNDLAAEVAEQTAMKK